jgi:hypothetical protein
MAKAALVLVAILSLPTLAAAQDRASALPRLERNCQNTLLANPQDVRGLAILQIEMPQFCSCAATQMIATFSDAEVMVFSKSGQAPARLNDVWQAAGKFCKAMLMHPR